MSTTTRAIAAAASSLLLVLAAGCSGSDGAESKTPEEVLSAAKTTLDETSGVHVVLETEELPPEVDGILSADGYGTHAPAFQGSLTVSAGGVTADASVVAVDGVVHAKLPFTSNFVEIDPADYGAPDPAALMEPEGGLSSLLTEAQDVTEGEQRRDGEQVLTTYAGTVPGEAVSAVIPSADAQADFDAEFTVTDEQALRRATLTGPFYPDAEAVTYTITFDQYDTEREITAP
jgi:lipoprotein LprG